MWQDPSFRALSGRLKFAVRRHTFNEDSLSADGRRVGAVRSASRGHDLHVNQPPTPRTVCRRATWKCAAVPRRTRTFRLIDLDGADGRRVGAVRSASRRHDFQVLEPRYQLAPARPATLPGRPEIRNTQPSTSDPQLVVELV